MVRAPLDHSTNGEISAPFEWPMPCFPPCVTPEVDGIFRPEAAVRYGIFQDVPEYLPVTKN